jgi:hypothetical protein
MAMFKSTKAAPVVGGLIRSGIGTKIHLVIEVLPYHDHWVVACQPVGRMVRGEWRATQPSRLNGNGGYINGYEFKEVYTSGYNGFHAVTAGADCPEECLAAVAQLTEWCIRK